MELTEAMRTLGAIRYFEPTPLPDEVLLEAMEHARFGPQGGNRQGVRLVAVRDPATKKQLGEWYRGPSEAALAGIRDTLKGQASEATERYGEGIARTGLGPERMLASVEHLLDHWDELPAMIVVCIDLTTVHFTDLDLDRVSIVGGASVYPIVQNFLLALRAQGVASVLTTLLVEYETQVKELLEIPDDYATACHILAGYPSVSFPKKLNRLPADELIFADRFGEHLSTAS